MNYKYKKGQIFGKRLNVSESVRNRVYNCTLSLYDFVRFELYDKIPISCLKESDRQIVERLGVEKAKKLDLDLLLRLSVHINEKEIRESLMNIDLNAEEVNVNLYELLKDRISPFNYSPGMKELYSNRVFIENADDKQTVRIIKGNFNSGNVSLEEIVHNWDLFKDMDLGYCLLKDEKNKNGITDNQLKQLMEQYKNLMVLVNDKTDIYRFISEITKLTTKEEKYEYIKQLTDGLLKEFYNKTKTFTDDEFKEIFKYSSIEECIESINAYTDDKIIDEMKTLPQDYIFNMSIPMSSFLDYNVLYFIGAYGLKNIIALDNEYDNYLTRNNCSELKSMSNACKRFTHSAEARYRYTFLPEDLLDELDSRVLQSIIEGKIKSYENMPSRFKNNNPMLFLSPNVPEDIRKKFYNREFTLNDFNSNIDLLEMFGDTNIVCGFSEEVSWMIPLFKNSSNQKMENFKRLKLISAYSRVQELDMKTIFREYVEEFKDDIKIENLEYISEVLTKLSLSNSSEIFTFRKELAKQIINSPNPLESLNQIENVFIKNNLPTIGKIYSCFEILHPDFQGFNFDNSMVSPVLQNSSNMSKKIIVFSDLIKASFGSNNKSVNAYLKNIEIGSKLYENIRNGNVQYDALSQMEKNELIVFSQHLATLYNNTMKGKKEGAEFLSTGDVLTDILELSKKLSPDGTLNYNLADRVIKMFCGLAGIDTLEQAKDFINKKVQTADARNRISAQTDMILRQGDFVKGIGGIAYLGNILQNGSVSKEYLGASAGSDATPLDTDISMVMSADGTASDKIGSTAAAGYGPIWFVLKNDERFITTRNNSGTIDTKRDLSKMEVFYTGALGEGHYGIRTGFASSDIDYIVMEEYDPRVGLEIAINGFYIPVANKDGKIVFTPEDYDKLRGKMNGLSYYGMGNYVADSSLYMPSQEIMDIVSDMNNNRSETKYKGNLIRERLEHALAGVGLTLKDNIDLSNGSAILFNTGSTGRFTNMPGDGDFDYTMQIDKDIYASEEKMNELRQQLIAHLSNGIVAEYAIVGSDIREFKTTIKDEQGNEYPVEIDITFTQKTDKVEYASDVCVTDRLNSIASEQERELVKANIIYAKKFLKSIEAYKPARKFPDQGGLGGIGVENWILQNGGTFYSAAKSFVEAANKCQSFEQFQSLYSIPNFGHNHMAHKKGFYPHDNYIDNMNEIGYDKMVQALNEYLRTVENTQVSSNTVKR